MSINQDPREYFQPPPMPAMPAIPAIPVILPVQFQQPLNQQPLPQQFQPPPQQFQQPVPPQQFQQPVPPQQFQPPPVQFQQPVPQPLQFQQPVPQQQLPQQQLPQEQLPQQQLPQPAPSPAPSPVPSPPPAPRLLPLPTPPFPLQPEADQIQEDDYETRLERAEQALNSRDLTSIYEASFQYKVDNWDLSVRLGPDLTRRLIPEGERLLSPYLEDELSNWIIDSFQSGYPRSMSNIREYAELFLSLSQAQVPAQAQGQAQVQGQEQAQAQGRSTNSVDFQWVVSFLNRKSDLIPSINRNNNSALQRNFGPTFTLIENFVQYFNDKSKQYQIKPSRVFQYDETIYITGSSIANMSIFGYKNKANIPNCQGINILCTSIECTSSDGEVMTPAFIFNRNGSSVADNNYWNRDDLPNWLYASSVNGLSNGQFFLQWLIDVFIPYQQERNQINPHDDNDDDDNNNNNNDEECILLIHEPEWFENIRYDVEQICYDNKIIIVSLPQYSNHIIPAFNLEPLSLSPSPFHYSIPFYSSLSSSNTVDHLQSTNLNNFLHKNKINYNNTINNTTTMLRQQILFVNKYCQLRPQYFTKANIIHYWGLSGIKPFDVSNLLDSSEYVREQIRTELIQYNEKVTSDESRQQQQEEEELEELIEGNEINKPSIEWDKFQLLEYINKLERSRRVERARRVACIALIIYKLKYLDEHKKRYETMGSRLNAI